MQFCFELIDFVMLYLKVFEKKVCIREKKYFYLKLNKLVKTTFLFQCQKFEAQFGLCLNIFINCG